MDHFRDNKKKPANIDEEQLYHLVVQQLDEGRMSAFVKEEYLKFISREVQYLPERQKMTIELFFLKGMSVKEVAEAMGIDETSVYTNRKEAIKKLKEKFARQFKITPNKNNYPGH